MATQTTGITSLLNYAFYDYWEEAWDPRSRHLAFVDGGPLKMLSAMIAYVVFCGWVGPALMKNRKPFELRIPMLIYNVTSVAVNTYFFIMSAYYLNFGLELFNFKFPSSDPKAVTEVDLIKVRLVFIYILTKLFDLLDTFFFVLRKKNSQISGLHLYHHSVVPLLGWLSLKIAPTASCLGLFPLVNTLVHIIMYTYYALSSLGPSVQPYLWWKKYITQIQLAQFVLYGVYTVFFLRLQEGYPIRVWGYIGGSQPFIFFYLFFRFYMSSYNSSKKKQLQPKKCSDEMEALNDNNNNVKKEL